MQFDANFWGYIDRLVASSSIVIDRSKGSTHPRFPDIIYPLDYGYLDGTVSGDGEGIDVWIGSSTERSVVGIVCTVDLFKKDMEMKILIGCTSNEIEVINRFLSKGSIRCKVVLR